MANANEGWHFRPVENGQNFVLQLVAFFKRAGEAISDAARWIYHAPVQLIHAIANAFKALWDFIKWLGVLTLKTILIFIALLLMIWAIAHLMRLVRIACKTYDDRRAMRDLEAAAMRNSTRTQRQVPHRHHDEHIFRSYQYEAEREEERRRHDRSQRAEEQRRAAEQERKRHESERESQRRRIERSEDLRRYRHWQAKYNVVLSNGYGVLPKPPYWPCNEVECQEEGQIKACYHSLGRLFNSTKNPRETLKNELRTWHPDRQIL